MACQAKLGDGDLRAMDFMRTARLTILLLLALGCSTCGNGKSGPAGVLPGNKEISTWKIAEGPRLVKTETEFYNWIDGGAPKYLEHGWASSAYAEYRRDAETIQVAVHDMGTPENAESLFNRDRPSASTEISQTSPNDPAGRRPNAVINMALSSSYKSNAFSHRYYLEAIIDAKTDAAFADLKEFMLHMMERAR